MVDYIDKWQPSFKKREETDYPKMSKTRLKDMLKGKKPTVKIKHAIYLKVRELRSRMPHSTAKKTKTKTETKTKTKNNKKRYSKNKGARRWIGDKVEFN